MGRKVAYLMVARKHREIDQERARDKTPFKGTPPVTYFPPLGPTSYWPIQL
jgi:hypothetical protein